MMMMMMMGDERKQTKSSFCVNARRRGTTTTSVITKASSSSSSSSSSSEEGGGGWVEHLKSIELSKNAGRVLLGLVALSYGAFVRVFKNGLRESRSTVGWHVRYD